MAHVRPKRFEYTATVDRDGRVSADHEPPAPLPAELSPEHLVLAGLGRCTLASLSYHARRASLETAGAASAWGVVTTREEDGRYAFVEIACRLDVELEPLPGEEQLAGLLAKAERDCFVGASLRVPPGYEWRVHEREVE